MIWDGDENHKRFMSGAYVFDADSINHEESKTTKAVVTLEHKLKSALTKLIKDMQTTNLSIPDLRRTYGEQVQAVISSTVQNVFIEALRYVDKFNEGGVMLNDQDLRTISATANKYNENFWLNAGKIINRNEVMLQDYGYEERDPLNVGNQLSLLSTSLTIGLLSQTTLDFAKTTNDPDIRIVWITALDEMVCPICRPLHGREYEMNDPNILVPGAYDSHHNCRCRLLVKYKGEIYDA